MCVCACVVCVLVCACLGVYLVSMVRACVYACMQCVCICLVPGDRGLHGVCLLFITLNVCLFVLKHAQQR